MWEIGILSSFYDCVNIFTRLNFSCEDLNKIILDWFRRISGEQLKKNSLTFEFILYTNSNDSGKLKILLMHVIGRRYRPSNLG